MITYPINQVLLLKDLMILRPLVMGLYACLLITVCLIVQDKKLPDILGYIFAFTLAVLSSIIVPILVSELSFLLAPLPCGVAIGLTDGNSFTSRFTNTGILCMDNNGSNHHQSSNPTNGSGAVSNSGIAPVSLTPQRIMIGNRTMFYHPGIGVLSSSERPNYIIVGSRVTDTTGWSDSDIQSAIAASQGIPAWQSIRRTQACSHNSLANFTSTSQADVDTFNCEMRNTNAHRAFDSVGDNAKLCNHCHSVFCKSCSNN